MRSLRTTTTLSPRSPGARPPDRQRRRRARHPADLLARAAARTARSGRRASSREGFVISDSVEKLRSEGARPPRAPPPETAWTRPLHHELRRDGGRRARSSGRAQPEQPEQPGGQPGSISRARGRRAALAAGATRAARRARRRRGLAHVAVAGAVVAVAARARGSRTRRRPSGGCASPRPRSARTRTAWPAPPASTRACVASARR